MSSSLLSLNNLYQNDSEASDHLPLIVDFVLPNITQTGLEDFKSDKDIIQIIDFLGRDTKEKNNIPLFYFYDDGSVEKKIIIE